MEARIDVMYMYAFSGMSSNNAIMIFCFSDNDNAIEILLVSGVRLLDAEAFGVQETES